MPESLEEIATCALYEPTAQREAVLAREIIALRELYQDGVRQRDEDRARIQALEAAAPLAFDGRPENAHLAQLVAMRAERDEALTEREEEVSDRVTQETRRLAEERDEAVASAHLLQQQFDASRAALAKYGRHLHHCRIVRESPPVPPCTCGLADALAATTPTASGS